MLVVKQTNPAIISIDDIEFTVSSKGIVRARRANHSKEAIEAVRPQAKAWAATNVTNHTSQAPVQGATGNQVEQDELDPDCLVTSDTSTSSKKDRRGEKAYRKLKDALTKKMMTYIAILQEEPTKAIDEVTRDFDKRIENLLVNRHVMAEWLSFNKADIEYMVGSTIKVLIKETVMHEQSLNAAASMIAKRIKPLVSRSGFTITIKRKLELGEYEILAAAQLLLIAKQLGFYKEGVSTAKAREGMDFAHSYKTVKFVYHTEPDLEKYLKKSTDVEAKTYAIPTKLEYSGDYNKLLPAKQPAILTEAIKKLQEPEYTIDNKLASNYLKQFQATLTHEEALKLPDFLQERKGQKFRFPAKVGPDNGRLYLGGYLLPAQQGGRNWLVRFAKKRKLTASGKAALLKKIDSYDHKAILRAPAKKRLEYLNYLSMLEDVEQGKSVGGFIGLDGILMGMQTHALLLQDKTQYHYCTVEDGRSLMAEELGLTKNGVKGGISPYSYGAGEKTSIAGILEFAAEGGEKERATAASIVTAPGFWTKWEKSFQKYFPATYKLREFIRGYAKVAKLGCRVNYTTWAGINATITPLKSTETFHNTVLGQLTYKRTEIISDEFGSKLVAAVGHELDSSILTLLVIGAKYAIKPVHDEYCVHPNDCKKLEKDFTAITKRLRTEGPQHLFDMVNEMFCDYVDIYGPINTNILVTGDLKDSDIVCGIN